MNDSPRSATVTELRRADEQQRLAEEAFRRRRGGDTPGGVTDDWKASVDAQLKQLHEDVRRVTGYVIAGAIGPFLITVSLVVGFSNSTNGRIDRVAEGSAALAREVGAIDARVDDISRRLDRIEAKIDLLVSRGGKDQPAR